MTWRPPATRKAGRPPGGISRLPIDLYHLVAAARGSEAAAAVPRPIVHQPPALFKQITAPIRRFDLVGHDMPQRGFRNLARIVGGLGAPILEAAAETMGHVPGTKIAH